MPTAEKSQEYGQVKRENAWKKERTGFFNGGHCRCCYCWVPKVCHRIVIDIISQLSTIFAAFLEFGHSSFMRGLSFQNVQIKRGGADSVVFATSVMVVNVEVESAFELVDQDVLRFHPRWVMAEGELAMPRHESRETTTNVSGRNFVLAASGFASTASET
jgi:hypothetical protein